MSNEESHAGRRSSDNDGPTPHSIAAARAAQQRERDEVFKRTGIRLTFDGQPVLDSDERSVSRSPRAPDQEYLQVRGARDLRVVH